MHRTGWILSLIVLAGVSVAPASAQYLPGRANYGGGVGGARPPLSPYLNLLRGGDPSANYFLGVIPEQQRRVNAYQTRTSLQELEARTPTATTDPNEELLRPLPQTGHATAFGNQLNYFPRPGLRRY
jgi:hypothetical protein